MTAELTLPLDAEPTLATLDAVGGKGANLAKLARAGFPVPPGFLIPTAAYCAFVEENRLTDWCAQSANNVRADDPAALEAVSQEIRSAFTAGTMPAGVADVTGRAYRALGSPPVAVRSSATAEDLPDLSFAGQQDTYLNVVGEEALLQAVVACWSSLWTARAIGYRARNGIPHSDVALSVVVQEMVPSEVSGVLFTANPLTGKRTEIVIDATLGLGEALVAGLVEPDHYVVGSDSERIIEKRVGAKALAIQGRAGGGTVTLEQDAAQLQALPDDAILELARLAGRVADLYGTPQDIEWAWARDELFLLQSRPITSLYPLPDRLPPEPLRLLLSFGSLQGILDPITPLGQDVLRTMVAVFGRRAGYDMTPQTQQVMFVAGERLFLNVTGLVRNQVGRKILQRILPLAEPGVAEAMGPFWEDPRLAPQGDGIRPQTLRRLVRLFGPVLVRYLATVLRAEARRGRMQQKIENLLSTLEERSARTTTLASRLTLLEETFVALPRLILEAVIPTLAPGLTMLALLNRLAASVPSAKVDVLEMTRGLPNNVTTEMDLALWEVARTIQGDPESLMRFKNTDAGTLAHAYAEEELPPHAQQAVAVFLKQYGMRGVGEIDFGRPRWREDPTPLMQALHSYLRIESPEQAPDHKFRQGAVAAEAAMRRLEEALRGARNGWVKALLARWIATRMRALAGLRETPKFTVIRLFGINRAGLLQSGKELAEKGILAEPDDLFFLRLPELKALARGEVQDWKGIVTERRARYRREQQRRQIPRAFFSDGQAFYEGVRAPIAATDGQLAGSPVSPGIVEGVVRVVLEPHGAQLAPGEILVCPGTDPSWTPLFLAAGGLVMEVGGLMTHGAVVAREYGIPAVVGVHQAATLLRSGQRVRVDGSAGQITLLDAEQRAAARERSLGTGKAAL